MVIDGVFVFYVMYNKLKKYKFRNNKLKKYEFRKKEY